MPVELRAEAVGHVVRLVRRYPLLLRPPEQLENTWTAMLRW